MASAIRIPDVTKKVVAVLGLARSGLAAVEALHNSGAIVWAWDDAEKARANVPEPLLADLHKADWSKATALVMSPGIPTTFPTPNPVAAAAKAAGLPLISDIELLHRAEPKARFVGITGTNGKSTVTTLLGHVLKSAGRSIAVGGNLGQAVLGLPALGGGGIYVLELSSYQLDITPSAVSDVAILLNITPDHLDRHGGMEGYIASKKLIMRPKGAASLGIIGVDDEACRKLFAELKAEGKRRMVPISAERAVEGGVSAVSGKLVDAIAGKPIDVLDLNAVERLPGKHNWQNAAAAYAAARALGLGIDDVVEGIKSYPGLVHRQELVATIDGIRFVNDSKATNADAAAKALACYDNIYWIAGGKPKDGGLAGLEQFYPRIRRAYLIGEAAQAFGKQLGSAVKATQSGTLDQAVIAAAQDAKKDAAPSPVVLLSPACASFDQYNDFEERGDHFRQIVATLQAKGGRMIGFARTDRSALGQWWWTVDRWTLAAIIALMFVGAILVLAASPAVATRIGLDSFYLVRHHYMMLPAAAAVLIAVSVLTPRQVRRLGVVLFLFFLALTAMTLGSGMEIKGATRWIDVGPVSLQPSEFLKPCFAIFTAWMFALQRTEVAGQRIPGNLISIAMFGITVLLLIKQPDLGMTVVITATWAAQFFVAGLPIFWVALLVGVGVAGLVGAYFMLPHVTDRVNQFLDPSTGDTYQIDRALEAFSHGGLVGQGPGGGTVKLNLPDAHADFVFAVAGEEFGMVVCTIIVALFAFVVLRSLLRMLGETNLFVLLAVTGLVTSFGLQAVVNMGSTLHLMPTKGMTLPFISYGGSSIIAIALGVGMLLALTRKRFPGSQEI